VKVPVVGMFFPEYVLGVHREFLASLQNIRKLFNNKFELLTAEFRAEPDNKTRDLIHDFFLQVITITTFPGGDKHISQKSL